MGLWDGVRALAQGPEPSSTETNNPSSKPTASVSPTESSDGRLITLDFNNVDLVVFVRFVSEIVGKNFVIDERVRGKVTIFSPAKIPVDKVYEVFLSVLELKGFAAVESGETIQILPSTEVPVGREIYVHFLENADAEEITKLLMSIVGQPGRGVKQKKGRKATPRRTAGAVPSDFEGQIQITPDKTINALIIRAAEADYEKLKKIIEQLDIKRQQVFVEAVFMEMDLDTIKEFGTEIGGIAAYVFDTGDIDVGIGGLFNTNLSELGGGGGDFSLADINVGVVVRALQELSGVNILSTPQILTTHNQKARIVVGENVPFVMGSTTTTGGNVNRNINRQDVGVTLEITPRVMEKGQKVELEIRQEISRVTETAESVLIELGPTTRKREAMTTVIVDNHQTVVIGGLMRDDMTTIERKVPLLGDIPLIGWLFKFKSKKVIKTNLLIFLTPHILQDAEDLEAIRLQKTAQMRQDLLGLDEERMKAREIFLDPVNLPGPS